MRMGQVGPQGLRSERGGRETTCRSRKKTPPVPPGFVARNRAAFHSTTSTQDDASTQRGAGPRAAWTGGYGVFAGVGAAELSAGHAIAEPQRPFVLDGTTPTRSPPGPGRAGRTKLESEPGGALPPGPDHQHRGGAVCGLRPGAVEKPGHPGRGRRARLRARGRRGHVCRQRWRAIDRRKRIAWAVGRGHASPFVHPPDHSVEHQAGVSVSTTPLATRWPAGRVRVAGVPFGHLVHRCRQACPPKGRHRICILPGPHDGPALRHAHAAGIPAWLSPKLAGTMPSRGFSRSEPAGAPRSGKSRGWGVERQAGLAGSDRGAVQQPGGGQDWPITAWARDPRYGTLSGEITRLGPILTGNPALLRCFSQYVLPYPTGARTSGASPALSPWKGPWMEPA